MSTKEEVMKLIKGLLEKRDFRGDNERIIC
jgi:hypothetical protein